MKGGFSVFAYLNSWLAMRARLVSTRGKGALAPGGMLAASWTPSSGDGGWFN